VVDDASDEGEDAEGSVMDVDDEPDALDLMDGRIVSCVRTVEPRTAAEGRSRPCRRQKQHGEQSRAPRPLRQRRRASRTTSMQLPAVAQRPRPARGSGAASSWTATRSRNASITSRATQLRDMVGTIEIEGRMS
jgi:hypothetical protein